MLLRSMIATLFLIAACGAQQESPDNASTEGAAPVGAGDGAGATTPPGGAKTEGTLSGTVNFVGKPCPQPSGPPCDGPYPDYQVVIYAADGTTEVARTRTGADGVYSTDVQVSRDALSKTDLRVDTGIR
jgi:hypothetical protein